MDRITVIMTGDPPPGEYEEWKNGQWVACK